jgi:hypothetical protein
VNVSFKDKECKYSLFILYYCQGGDDTAANYIKFKCGRMDSGKSSYELAHASGHGFWGEMTGWCKACPTNSAICGI